MLELLGSEYVIDHIIAEHNNRTKEVIFRNYISDIMKAIAECFSVSVTCEYRELTEPSTNESVSGDEVALRVIKKLGLKVGTNGNGFDVAESDTIT